MDALRRPQRTATPPQNRSLGQAELRAKYHPEPLLHVSWKRERYARARSPTTPRLRRSTPQRSGAEMRSRKSV